MNNIKLLAEHVEFPNLFSGEIPIDRVAFKIFDFNVYWYAIIIAAGLLLAVLYCSVRAKKFGFTSDDITDIALIGGLCGFVGARAYYCIFWNLNPENTYKFTLWTAISEIHMGGLAIYGGIIAGVIGGILVCKHKKISMLTAMDLGGCGFLIGQSIGRWGNFVNQEAYGAVTAPDYIFGMTGSHIATEMGRGTLVHPCFLYESVWCILGLLIIHFILSKIQTFDGELFLYYVIWYGSGRGFIEGLRTDSLYIGPLRVSQLLGIASAVFCLILVIYIKVKIKHSDSYKRWKDTETAKIRTENYQKALSVEKETAKAYKAMAAVRKNSKKEEIAPSILGDDNEE